MRTNPTTPPGIARRLAIELRVGDARVVLDPDRGGRLAALTVRGRELLLGPPTGDDRSIAWGCYLMAPWAGRLAGGRFDWAGRTIQLPRTHGRHAIHGLLWNRPWDVEAVTARTATLVADLGDAGWPMGGRVRHHVQLEPEGVRLEAVIEADEAMPAVIGWHPWFRRDGDARLRVDADTTLATERMLPTGVTNPVAGRTDLRRGPPLGRRRLDHAYVGAVSPAVLTWADLELTIAFTPTPATVVVHTPAGKVCVEPQTAWPNALALPEADRGRSGVRVLRPGGTLTASMDLRWRALAPRP
jgi:aldose 1-epimerase